MTESVYLFAAVIAISGCGGGVTAPASPDPHRGPEPPRETEAVDQTPHQCPCREVIAAAQARQAPSASPDGDVTPVTPDASEEETGAPPLYLIEENMDTTHFSGIVRIERAEVIDDTDGETGDPGYVNHRYRVTVLKRRVGTVPGTITLSEAVERGARPMAVGRILFVSLCRSDTPGIYYTPDNGYMFDATDAVLKKLKQIKRSKKAPENPSACEP